MGRFIVKLNETPNFDRKELENLCVDVWIGGNNGSHNELRIKFKNDNDLIPLRMNQQGVKLDNKYTIKSLKLNSKLFYSVCDWFICNRDIINTYFTYSNEIPEVQYVLDKFIKERDKEITKNKEPFMLPYTKTENGCSFTTPQQIPINVDMKNISIEMNQMNETISEFVRNSGID